MDYEKLKDLIRSFMPDVEIVPDSQILNVSVHRGKMHNLAEFLRNSKETSFNYLYCESAVDYNDYFMIIYHIESTEFRHQMVIKTKITNREIPEVDSVSDIWIGAEYHEREIFDLFGIRFINHPDLRKIFLDNDWVGFPLRKDYTDPVNIIER